LAHRWASGRKSVSTIITMVRQTPTCGSTLRFCGVFGPPPHPLAPSNDAVVV
jgi:hypothetical protein